jgi:hypothetical protein
MHRPESSVFLNHDRLNRFTFWLKPVYKDRSFVLGLLVVFVLGWRGG